MKIEAAVSELATEYAGQVECNVIPAEETEERWDEIASYGFADERHGLVGFGADGEILVKIPGHQYGEPEVRAAIETLLAEDDTTASDEAFETIEFPSEDGLTITADLYRFHEDPKAPFIVLFHQAGWSRGEYREIAPRLGALGFDGLAVDQRSGGAIHDVPNETAKRASAAELGTDHPDALPDMRAAIDVARERWAEGPLLIWGSSYSAALALKLAGDEPQAIDAVLAFAPGEYFERFGHPSDWITRSAESIHVPVFITSARDEKPSWLPIFEAIPSETKRSFVPETAGNHGSRALWERFVDSPAYWSAVEAFLDEHVPRSAPE